VHRDFLITLYGTYIYIHTYLYIKFIFVYVVNFSDCSQFSYVTAIDIKFWDDNINVNAYRRFV
jgi:hypothetical protein